MSKDKLKKYKKRKKVKNTSKKNPVKVPKKKTTHKKSLKKNTTSKATTSKTTTSKGKRRSKSKTQRTKRQTVVKKSLATAKVKNSSPNTYFLVLALFLCLLAIGVISFILLAQFVHKDKLFSPPIPHRLSTIPDEKTFLTIKNSLLQSAQKINSDSTDCAGSDFFHTSSRKTAYAYGKFLIILKRGKLFVTNTSNNKFVSYTEISPYPTKEDNAIAYDNVFLNKGTIIVTGYRAKTSSFEIATFSMNSYGKVTRGEIYNLPSSNCNFASNLSGDKLTLYTSRILSSDITLSKIKTLNKWSNKLNLFIPIAPKNSTVFYDNHSLLTSPIVHTITTCQPQENSLINCQQRHLIGNNSSGHYLSTDNFYLWTTQLSGNDKIGRITPSSKLHRFNLSKPTIQMTQIEGAPISKNSLLANDTQLLATIYQNNNRAPAWHTNFSKNKIANFKLDLDDFTSEGSFVNSPDNYSLVTTTFHDILDNSAEMIATSPRIITLNKITSTINIYAELIKSFSIDGLILSAKKLPNQEIILVIYKKDNLIMAQTIDINNNILSNTFSLQEDSTTVPLVQTYFLNFQRQTFASISLTEESLNKGSIHLLNISTSELTRSDRLAFTNSYQRLTDGCQNDCQQAWQTQVNYFILPNILTDSQNNFIYATIGSKLRKLSIDTLGNIHLYKTIDYTYRPAPPKPKRPRARIPGGAKKVNGKYVCGKKHGYVGKSKSNNKGYLHLDLECCLDPDEYPNPWCTYKPGELGVTKLRYKDYHGRVKRKKH